MSDTLLCDSFSLDGLPLLLNANSPVILAAAALAICAAAVCAACTLAAAACAVSSVKSAAADHTGWEGTLGSDGTSGEGVRVGSCDDDCSDGGSSTDGLLELDTSGIWLIDADAAGAKEARHDCRRVGVAQLRRGSSHRRAIGAPPGSLDEDDCEPDSWLASSTQTMCGFFSLFWS